MNERGDYKRRFETECDNGWNTPEIDDMLYGKIRTLTTYNEEDDREYVTKRRFNANREVIYRDCKMNARKVNRQIHKMLHNGTLKEFEQMDELFDKSYPSYEIVKDLDHSYVILELNFLEEILKLKKKNVLKVYSFLLKGHDWKYEKLEDPTPYWFTYKSLARHLGYDENSNSVRWDLKNIIVLLEKRNLILTRISYKQKCLDDGSIVPIPITELLDIARDYSGMNRIKKKKEERIKR